MARRFRHFGVLLALAGILAASVRLAATPAWTIVSSPNFVLLGDTGEKSLHDVALRLEQFRAVIALLFPRLKQSTGVPTVVVVFGSNKAYEPFRPRYQGKTVQVAGYFVQASDSNYVTLTTDNADDGLRVVYHEYTHFLVGNWITAAPVWLNEGLAEFYSTFALKSDGKGAFIGRVIPQHVFTLRDRFIPLSELIAVDRRSPLYNEGDRRSIFYAESWALIHYLLTEVGDGRERIDRYLTGVAAGQAVDRAFAAAFGDDINQFESKLRNYVRRRIYNEFEFRFAERVAADQGGKGRPLSAGEIEAWAGDLLLHMNRADAARVRLQKALTLDPDVARAHLSLGLLALSENHGAEAWPHLQRAVALDAANAFGQYTYGLSVLNYRGGSPSTATDAPTIDDARTALNKAVALQPDFADALAAIGYAALLADEHFTEARASLTRAVAIAPGRLDYAFRLAEVCVRQGDYAEARRILNGLVGTTDEYATSDHARSLLSQLDRFARGTEGAGTSGGTRVIFTFRQTRDGERRSAGRLERIECGVTGLIVHLNTGAETLRFNARQFGDIEFISYRDDLTGTIACGPRDPPDVVYVTWTEPLRQIVAIEFLPKGFVPER
jgi:tetratricopeptide (TPR) repeat protein